MVSFGSIKKIIHRPKLERGQAFVIVAIGMVAMIAVIGLATDAAMIYKTKQDLQRAIDSAALAGAYKLPDQTTASKTIYEFTRLHGYNFDPSTKPLQISFPDSATKKIVNVKGTTNAKYFFLRIIGFQTMNVSATGQAEAAPLDVYLILDLSESMTYDTYYKNRPNPWPVGSPGYPGCTWGYKSDCVAKYCNWAKGNPDGTPPVPIKDADRLCDPLDTSIKPAAKYFIDQLDSRYDRVGLVTYEQAGIKVVGLTGNFTAVKAAIDDLSAFDRQENSSGCPNTSPAGCNKQTNIGDGIMVAHTNIALPYDPITKTGGGREDSIWSMVLLTDGKANVYRSCTGCPPSCGALACNTLYLCNECTSAENWAINNAKDTWTRHETVIYTIAYGTESPGFEDLMIKIANCTDNGNCNDASTDNFWAAPDMDSLYIAFHEIAERIYARLLQ